MKGIQKLFILSVAVFLLFLGAGSSEIAFATESIGFKVKVITETKLYENPELKTSTFDIIIKFGEELTVVGEEEIDENSGFVFYPVSYEKDNEKTEGYIIKNFVIKIEDVPLERTLDPNAKTLQSAQVYRDRNEESKLQIKGEDIILERYQPIKVIDSTDSKYKKIMFEIDGEIYTGFIKSEHVLIEGFNSTIILVIFIFLLAGSIALSIVLTTRKKRKRKAKSS